MDFRYIYENPTRSDNWQVLRQQQNIVQEGDEEGRKAGIEMEGGMEEGMKD